MPLLDKLLRDRPKSCPDTVAKLVTSLEALEVDATSERVERSLAAVAKYLAFLKVYLFGDAEHEVTKESVLDCVKGLASTDLLYLVVKHLVQLDFEARKDAAQVFGVSVRIKDEHDRSPGAAYVFAHPYIMNKLFEGCEGTVCEAAGRAILHAPGRCHRRQPLLPAVCAQV
jgi:calcium binding protein 39